jgi:hypothetical protein
MSRGPIIRRVDANSPVFKRTFKGLPREVQGPAIEAFKTLFLPPDQRPAKVHFHKLRGFEDIWTIHISSDDRYKASFRLDGDLATMRRCGTHEEIDKSPE